MLKEKIGKIRLTKIIDPQNNSYGCIELEDRAYKRIVEIHMDFSEFGEFILSRGTVNCKYFKYKK